MRSRTASGRVLLIPMTGLALVLAACSSGGSSTSTSASSPPPATSAGSSAPQSSAPAASGSAEPTSGTAAQDAIKANWEAFFSGKTSAAQKLALLQNGQTFATIVNDPQNLQMGQAATATVHSVTISGTTATVVYDIGIGGGLGLNNQKGTAVYQDGVWKVGDSSFCGLITLEHGGQKQGACQSVG